MLRTSFPLDLTQEASDRSYAGAGIFHFSAGLEDPEDLCRDLDWAFSALP